MGTAVGCCIWSWTCLHKKKKNLTHLGLSGGGGQVIEGVGAGPVVLDTEHSSPEVTFGPQGGQVEGHTLCLLSPCINIHNPHIL